MESEGFRLKESALQTALLFVLLAALAFIPTVDLLDHQQNEYDKPTGTVTVVGQNLVGGVGGGQVVRGLQMQNYSTFSTTTAATGVAEARTEFRTSSVGTETRKISRALPSPVKVSSGGGGGGGGDDGGTMAKIWSSSSNNNNSPAISGNTTDKSFSSMAGSAAFSSSSLSQSFKSALVAGKAESNEKPISFLVEPSPYPLASISSGAGGGGRASGPYFEVNKTKLDVAVKAGQDVVLDCTIILLKGRTVSWLRKKVDSVELLTVGNITYYNDPRLALRFRYPDNWRLAIDTVRKEDEGEYHCQVATHPVKTLVYRVKVLAPEVVIIDDHGHSVLERHYKVDSSLHLTCRATYIDEFEEKAEWQKDNRPLSRTDNRIKIRLAKYDEEGESNILLSILWLDVGDSGNYTCVVGSHAKYTVVVHVVNGELPAAVQHESGATTGKQLGWLATVMTGMYFYYLAYLLICNLQ